MTATATGAIDAGRHMDRIYRRQRHVYDLTRKYYLLGRDALIRELEPGAGESVLEIGCGTGRNLIRAARRYPQARFFGIDISSEMLTTAHANIARAGLKQLPTHTVPQRKLGSSCDVGTGPQLSLGNANSDFALDAPSDRIILAQADATGFDAKALFGETGFDRVFLSYTLSMIPDWRKALDHGASLLNPGGRLSLVDFGQQERLPGAFRTLLFAWLTKFDVTPRADLPAAVEAAALRRNMVPHWQPKLRGYAWSARIERN